MEWLRTHDTIVLIGKAEFCFVVVIVYNTLRPRQNGGHFADEIFKRIFLNENILIPIKISLNFVPMGSINNIPALVQIMAWRRPGDKPLSEPMRVNLPTHIYVTRPQWVNGPQLFIAGHRSVFSRHQVACKIDDMIYVCMQPTLLTHLSRLTGLYPYTCV